ncbi:MAG TPA: hypothetical protein VFF36_02650, partial [Planctomycetota bacterium]|nr:hypothetical protein [Planctomycetota bacterium]
MRPMRPAAGVVWALALAALSLLAGAPAAQDEPPQMLYGSACGQFLPPPTLHFTGSLLPGEYGAIHVAGAPPGGFVILHIGTSNTTSSFGLLPFNLNGIAGIPSGCQLLTSGNYRIILNAKPDGTLKMGFKIPSTLGSDLYFQWAVVESAAPLSIVLTQGLHVSLMTNPAMHPVILAPEVVVDEDSDGSEAVLLDGSDSHTHEPGHVLTGWTWKEGYATLGTSPVVSAELAQGPHTVALIIQDDHVPANTLMDVHTLSVVPPTAVPGVSARYFDSGPADPATLLAAPPFATSSVGRISAQSAVAGGGLHPDVDRAGGVRRAGEGQVVGRDVEARC